MRRSAILTMTATAIAASVVAAAALAHRAVGVRAGSHPAYVRVVVDFVDGPLRFHEVEATDSSPADGRARLRVTSPGIQTSAGRLTALGVRALVRQGTNDILVELETQPRRFKYVSYAVLNGPDRLAIDLWRSRPPAAGARIRRAPDGCLTLGRFSVTGGRVRAAGRERNLFEHSLAVRVRGADGRLVRERPATGAGGRWQVDFPYTVSRAQPGTLEAVAGSAKDGALDCIVQTRVVLRP